MDPAQCRLVLHLGLLRQLQGVLYFDASDDEELCLMADIKVAFEEMLARRKGAAPLPTAVVHPCSEDALAGAVDAARAGLIDPVLVGPQEEIAEVAAKAKLDVSSYKSDRRPGGVSRCRRQSGRRRQGRGAHEGQLAYESMALSRELNWAVRNLDVPVWGSGGGDGSPRPQRVPSKGAECAAGCEMALDVEGVENGGVNRQETLG